MKHSVDNTEISSFCNGLEVVVTYNNDNDYLSFSLPVIL